MVPLLLLSAPALAFVPDAGGPYTVPAGGTVTLSAEGSVVDECSSVTYDWDLDGDGVVDVSLVDEPTVLFDAADVDGPAEFAVTLGLTCVILDTAGLSGRDETTLTVDNVPPVLGEPAWELPVVAGELAILSVEASDVEPADRLTIAWDFGDGDSARGTEIAHTWAEPGVYALVVSLRDDDGGEDRWEGEIEVVEEDPGDDGAADSGGGDGGTDGGDGGGGDDGGGDDGGGRDTFIDAGDDTGDGFAPEYEILGTGCSCGGGGAAAVFLPMLLMGWRRRRG